MGSLFLLPAYIFAETSRVIVIDALLHSGSPPSPSLTSFLAELGKLAFAGFFYWRKFYWASSSAGAPPNLSWRNGAWYAIPAACYLINNILYFTGLQLSTPVLLQVSMMAKLPLTAIAHNFIVTKQKNINAWYSVVALTVGLVVFNSPSLETHGPTHAGDRPVGLLIGPVIGLTISCISAGTGISTELLLKNSLDFWAGQIWLYFYGALFGGISYLCWDGTVAKTSSTPPTLASSSQFLFTTLVMTIMSGGVGLIVANILRKKDNLVKLIGSSACIVTVLLAQTLLYPSLRSQTLNRPSILGAGTIAIASWTYGFYRTASEVVKPGTPMLPTPIRLEDGEVAEPLLSEQGDRRASEVVVLPHRFPPIQKPSIWDPNPMKIGVAALVVVGLAMLV